MDTLILTSLLVLMGISTNQQRFFFLAGYLRLAMYRLYTKPASLFLPKGRRCIKKKFLVATEDVTGSNPHGSCWCSTWDANKSPKIGFGSFQIHSLLIEIH